MQFELLFVIVLSLLYTIFKNRVFPFPYIIQLEFNWKSPAQAGLFHNIIMNF